MGSRCEAARNIGALPVRQPGMLELPVLGLLKGREMHGYELRKQLGAMLGPLWQV